MSKCGEKPKENEFELFLIISTYHQVPQLVIIKNSIKPNRNERSWNWWFYNLWEFNGSSN